MENGIFAHNWLIVMVVGKYTIHHRWMLWDNIVEKCTSIYYMICIIYMYTYLYIYHLANSLIPE